MISAWSMFTDQDLRCVRTRPNARPQFPRAHGASVRQRGHLVPNDARYRRRSAAAAERRSSVGIHAAVMRKTAESASACCASKDDPWWEGETRFFDVRRSRAWVITRRLTHTAHHRGQQLALLRMLGREAVQQLRSDCRYRRPDARSSPHHLRLPEVANTVRSGSGGGEDEVARSWRRPVTERPDDHR